MLPWRANFPRANAASVRKTRSLLAVAQPRLESDLREERAVLVLHAQLDDRVWALPRCAD